MNAVECNGNCQQIARNNKRKTASLAADQPTGMLDRQLPCKVYN